MATATNTTPRPTKTLAERVRDARIGRAMTQKQLGEATGIAQNYLSQIENGQRTPSVEKLQTIAKALGLRSGDLLPDAA